MLAIQFAHEEVHKRKILFDSLIPQQVELLCTRIIFFICVSSDIDGANSKEGLNPLHNFFQRFDTSK